MFALQLEIVVKPIVHPFELFRGVHLVIHFRKVRFQAFVFGGKSVIFREIGGIARKPVGSKAEQLLPGHENRRNTALHHVGKSHRRKYRRYRDHGERDNQHRYEKPCLEKILHLNLRSAARR